MCEEFSFSVNGTKISIPREAIADPGEILILRERYTMAADSGLPKAGQFRSHRPMATYRILIPLLAGVILCPDASAQEVPLQPSHQSLHWYPDETGQPQALKTLGDWKKRRASIIAGFEEATGALPSREDLPDLDMQVTAKIETATYTRETITLASEAGDRTPAFLYLPKNLIRGEKRPGILALHPTSQLGKKIVDGQGERPNRAYARELAERGYVVIAPDYLSFGDYADYDFTTDRYESGTMKGIWNHMRCVDLLTSRPEVDREKIGAIGHSLGGHNAIFVALFDERIKVIVSSCGWTPLHDYYGGDLKGWTSERYIPAIRDRYALDPDQVPFDYYELIAALAPAAFFSNSPLRDSNFDWRGVEKVAPQARRIYELHGVPEKMRIAYPDDEHDFPTNEREESYRFLEKWLQ
ncbi:MAG: alpha/beta fold hydrolase [Verrucomicrobiales bacterium]|nr:alpha/beta fold hydrolase [Verrucomicrobiales bacterium]